MFSGKTTELIRRLRRYQIAKYKCLIAKYANDDRYSESDIVSHDQQSLAAVSARQITDIKFKALEYDVVGIDEGQFVSSILFLLHAEHILTRNLMFHCSAYFIGACGFYVRRIIRMLQQAAKAISC
jgi:thymidine kinase